MKTSSPLILLAWCLSMAASACSQKPNVINSYYRPLSEPELEEALAEQEAELIYQKEGEQHTFVVLDAGSKILHGSYDTLVVEYDNQESSEHINHSLSSSLANPKKKVAIKRGVWSRSTKNHLAENVLSSQGYVVVAIRDRAIQKEIASFKFTFKDQSEETVPATSQKGAFFQHPPDKECCSQLDLISKNNQTLYSKKF